MCVRERDFEKVHVTCLCVCLVCERQRHTKCGGVSCVCERETFIRKKRPVNMKRDLYI